MHPGTSSPRRATGGGNAREAIVLAGGDPVLPPLPRPLPPGALVIAADSGLAAAAALGLDVDLLVGDLDSVEPDDLAAVRAAGIEVRQHPADKDRTDLALALDAAVGAGATTITVVGGAGGRLDHLLGGLLLLGDESYGTCRLVALTGTAIVTVVRDEARITGRPGEYVSLLPIHGAATGITTSGLRFPLTAETLSAGSSRGVSNELTGRRATVTLRDGVLFVVQPGESAPPHEQGPL